VKITRVAAAVILREDGSFLLGRRAPGTYYPGYWEFPGGKVEAGETPHDALVRELAEEQKVPLLDLEAALRCSPEDRHLAAGLDSGDGLHLSRSTYRDRLDPLIPPLLTRVFS
jgi:ADP-ribose pyrophosphatase YjhB (NUDIX family)